MDTHRSTAQDHKALTAGAHQLQRAAGKVLEHAGGAEEPAALSVALAHIEEALDCLSVAMHQAAHAVTESYSPAGESQLDPSAEALCFYLRLAAERLRDPQLACQSARCWTRRLPAGVPGSPSLGEVRRRAMAP